MSRSVARERGEGEHCRQRADPPGVGRIRVFGEVRSWHKWSHRLEKLNLVQLVSTAQGKLHTGMGWGHVCVRRGPRSNEIALGEGGGRWQCRVSDVEDMGTHTLANLLDSQVTGVIFGVMAQRSVGVEK